jgi:hypothetical protein
MKAKAFSLLSSFILAGLFSTGCSIDSINPLSNPHNAEYDKQLVGLWRVLSEPGETRQPFYVYIGRAGGELPMGIMRMVFVEHDPETLVVKESEIMFFSTALSDKKYLNWLFIDDKQIETLLKTGWKSEDVKGYRLYKYKIEDNKLSLWGVDSQAKEQAIASGRIKGDISKDKNSSSKAVFTDSTENLARFVRENDGSLFPKEASPTQLERVK